MSETRYVTVYKAADGWRWHKVSSSDIVSESGEGYENKADAVAAAERENPDDEIRLEDG